jgi:hypothetical protein
LGKEGHVPRSAQLLRAAHLVLGVLFTLMLGWLLYEGISGRITVASWIAVGLFLVEGVILMVNRWSCPLTYLADKLGSEHGRVTDLFLPKLVADHAFQIFGAAFAVGFVLFVFRSLTD